MSRLTRDGTAEPVSRDQILRRERGQGNIDFPCSADHEQDWQPHPVDPYSCYICDHLCMHTLQGLSTCPHHSISGRGKERSSGRGTRGAGLRYTFSILKRYISWCFGTVPASYPAIHCNMLVEHLSVL